MVQAGVQSGAVASAVVGGMNVVGTIVAASAMDKAGRKQLLRLSFGGMGVAMLAMVAGLSLSSLAHLRGSIALFGTLAYVLTFSLGAGPVPGLLVPEITPARLRGTPRQDTPKLHCLVEDNFAAAVHVNEEIGFQTFYRAETYCLMAIHWEAQCIYALVLISFAGKLDTVHSSYLRCRTCLIMLPCLACNE